MDDPTARGELDRRTFFGISAAAAAGVFLPGAAPPSVAGNPFPRQDLQLVRQVVQFSHFDLDAVRELVSSRPALATASWDWGFGDWETPLGAASHVGRRPIAEFLLGHGARPDIFTFAMFGDLESVRSIIRSHPGVQRIPGPHGLTLLHHARAGGPDAEELVAYLVELGDADPRPTDQVLTQEQRREYTGVYTVDSTGASFQILDRRDHLAFRHEEDAPRTLLYQGNHEFHPVGAPAVRFVFEFGADNSAAVVIREGGNRIRATRAGSR